MTTLFEGFGKIVSGAGDIVNWAGAKLQDGGEYLAQPGTPEELKAKTKSAANTVKETVKDTAGTVSNRASDFGKQVAKKVEKTHNDTPDAGQDIVVDFPKNPADDVKTDPVVVEVLTPQSDSAEK